MQGDGRQRRGHAVLDAAVSHRSHSVGPGDGRRGIFPVRDGLVHGVCLLEGHPRDLNFINLKYQNTHFINYPTIKSRPQS